MRAWQLFIVLAGVLLTANAAQAQTPASGGGQDAARLAPDEIKTNLVKILRTSNKAQTNRYVPKVYEFQNVNPYAVIRWVRRFAEIEESAWFAFANEDASGGKLLVSCPEYQIEGLDRLMALIDRDGLNSASGDVRVLYRLKHRDGSDPVLLAACAQEGTPTAAALFDDHLNAWFLEDAPSGVDRICQAVVDVYDKPSPQLEALATVYEVDFSNDGQLGLDYIAWKNGPGRNLFAIGAFREKEGISHQDGPGTSALLYNSGKHTQNLPGNSWSAHGSNGAYFYDMPSAYFDFLEANGKARVLTRAKLAVLDGRTGLLEVGDEILYYEEQHLPDLRAGRRLKPLDPYGDLEALVDTAAAGETTDDFGVLVADYPDNRVVTPELRERSLGEVETGLFLRITPQINQAYCDVDFFMSYVDHTGYEDNGYPTVASRSIDTEFKVPHDGREVTLGGLVRKRRVDSTGKMPWLGDIPVLGYLFGGESHLEQETLVMTTLSCRVVPFGEGGPAPAERAVEEAVRGEGNVPTAPNPPGFIRE
ncbi:MAG: hypothetical protein HY812_03750 [Planctomycetes bacterium]|nr:hypothetical protein [Planctomycetota bacterium]